MRASLMFGLLCGLTGVSAGACTAGSASTSGDALAGGKGDNPTTTGEGAHHFDSLVRSFGVEAAFTTRYDSPPQRLFLEMESSNDEDAFLNNNFFAVDTDGRAYQLQLDGYVGESTLSESGRTVQYEAKFTGVGGTLKVQRDDDQLDITNPDETTTSLVRIEGETATQKVHEYVPLPNVHEPEYLVDLEASYLLITSPRYNYSYDFRAYLGEPGRMEEIAVLHVERWRDGGTTIIDTEAGEFYSPAPHSEDVPTFRGEDVRQLSIEDSAEVLEQLGIDLGTPEPYVPTY